MSLYKASSSQSSSIPRFLSYPHTIVLPHKSQRFSLSKNAPFSLSTSYRICLNRYEFRSYSGLFLHKSERLNDLMESKGGKKKSSSSSSCKSLFYEAPLGYSIEDIRPNGGIKKFRSAAYSNCARKPS